MSQPSAAPSLEGRIDVTLTRRGDAVGEVRIVSTRPQIAQRLMAGRSPEHAAELAGLLFTLCGRAQRIAAEAAAEAARGEAPSPTSKAQRELRVLAELAREHAWQLLVRGPEQTGQAPDLEALLHVQQARQGSAELAQALTEVLTERLLGEAPEAWLARDLSGLEGWIAGTPTQPARLLRSLDGGSDPGIVQSPLLPPLHRLETAAILALARRALDEPGVCARPLWLGTPAETGAVARLSSDPLVSAWIAARGRGAGARLLARLVELARLAQRPIGNGAAVVRAWPLGDGTGVAGVETSRGLLLHVLRLEAGRVRDYRIIAPTEWNFHAEGPLAEALAGLPADARLGARARLVVLSLDPCVDFGLEVRDA